MGAEVGQAVRFPAAYVIATIVVVITAVAAFFTGVEVSRSSPREAVTAVSTLTIPQRVTITQLITALATPQPQGSQTPRAAIPDKIVIGLTIPLFEVNAETGKRGVHGCSSEHDLGPLCEGLHASSGYGQLGHNPHRWL